MQVVKIELTEEDYRRFKNFLGKRYGSRKGIKTLIKLAATEIVSKEAQKYLDALVEDSR